MPVAEKVNTLATFTTMNTAEFTCSSQHQTLLVDAILKQMMT